MIIRNLDLQPHQTMACASQAEAAARVRSLAELREALAWAAVQGCPVRVLGEGSNVLAAERVDGLTLINEMVGLQVVRQSDTTVTVDVGSGINWHWWVRFSSAQGWHGLENLALIPGTVGAAPVQNIGAYGVEVEAFVEQVEALNLRSGEQRIFRHKDCAFSYRDSVFKGAERELWLITRVRFCLPFHFSPVLTYGPLQSLQNPTPRGLIDQVCQVRQQKLPNPWQMPNAGSFFTNPVVDQAQADALQKAFPGIPVFPAGQGRCKLAAGWLIDQAGWKGQSDPESGVGTWPQQALVIVNPQKRPRSDVLAFAERIQEAVEDRYEVRLEREPRLFG
ncbi:MAG: UDP-N-acetylmuramate dehydrogenase [Natronospirillum sp.]|uniref:UDP-N-acetylmuramate dehydrogenase n=1 Tax=Natronospirillum sp. TaxID=2812955 RepID=UPI0025DAAAF5|nr:UDP-N-acetylmuramate dehydrogenase [Natronospirillum sp.]MCH8553308.1 UDP-N-acetylmuramate dehydrogenase [Natronospirillum sp.]